MPNQNIDYGRYSNMAGCRLDPTPPFAMGVIVVIPYLPNILQNPIQDKNCLDVIYRNNFLQILRDIL